MFKKGDKVYYHSAITHEKKVRTIRKIVGNSAYFSETGGFMPLDELFLVREKYPLTLGQLIDTLEVGQVAERIGDGELIEINEHGGIVYKDENTSCYVGLSKNNRNAKYRILPQKNYIPAHEAIKALMEGKTVVSECEGVTTLELEGKHLHNADGILILKRFTDGKWYVKEDN